MTFAWLAGLLILGSAISAYVYFKIVRAMFARVDPAHVRDERSPSALPWLVVGVCALAPHMRFGHVVAVRAVADSRVLLATVRMNVCWFSVVFNPDNQVIILIVL
jgi:hypothetical protein